MYTQANQEKLPAHEHAHKQAQMASARRLITRDIKFDSENKSDLGESFHYD